MSHSYENINYGIRPGKAIERKMFCELFQKLSSFYPIKAYQYIGFGSTYFSDFSLFHKYLGLDKLISIEKDIDNGNRFKFNIPYSCIELRLGNSNDILPTIPLNERPTIIWLDYDIPLNSSVLSDIRSFIANAFSGSMILVSVNAHPFAAISEKDKSDVKSFRYKKLIENIGGNKIPVEVDGSCLNLENLSKVYRQIIDDEIKSVLKSRNNGRSNEDLEKLHYKQLVNMEYKDGAKMLTVGGVIFKGEHSSNYNSANFDHLDFYRDGDTCFTIQVPNLTYREIYKLESLLPSKVDFTTGAILDEANLIPDGINNISQILPLEDVRLFSKIYRYFPTFRESLH